MKKSVSILLLFISIYSAAQTSTCTNFKTGKFEYSKPIYADWNVIRTDSSQIEINTKTGVEIYNSVKWLNDCDYTLTCEKVENQTDTANNIVGQVYHVKITNVYSNRYTCEAVSDSGDVTLSLLMIKVDAFSD